MLRVSDTLTVKKPPTATQRLEFDKLRAFMAVGFEEMCSASGMAPEQHPVAIADRIWSESPSAALKGLRQAAADVVEMYQDMQGDDLAALERRFAAAGAPSLAAMRSRRVADIFRLLDRAEIRSDHEWRLLSAVVSDTADRILDESSRAAAERLLGEYEHSKKTD